MKKINYAESTPLHPKTRQELKNAPFPRDTFYNMDCFTYRLKQCRIHMGLTQKQTADKFNIQERQWRRYENNDAFPTVEGLIQIADFFGVSIDYLLGRAETSNFDAAQYNKNWQEWLNFTMPDQISEDDRPEEIKAFQDYKKKIIESLKITDENKQPPQQPE